MRKCEISRWREVVETERGYWGKVAQDNSEALRVMAYNAHGAARLRKWLAASPAACLEIGVGGLGVGLTGFLTEVPLRVGIDPVPQVALCPGQPLHDYLLGLRETVRYVVAPGERIPFRSESMDLVVCSNVLDHVLNPEGVLAEVHRVLRPRGHFLLEVHCFSVLGLFKWYSWTKHRHKSEPLVKSHPHRLTEGQVINLLRRRGLELVCREGHTTLSAFAGHAKSSVFLAAKQ